MSPEQPHLHRTAAEQQPGQAVEQTEEKTLFSEVRSLEDILRILDNMEQSGQTLPGSKETYTAAKLRQQLLELAEQVYRQQKEAEKEGGYGLEVVKRPEIYSDYLRAITTREGLRQAFIKLIPHALTNFTIIEATGDENAIMTRDWRTAADRIRAGRSRKVETQQQHTQHEQHLVDTARHREHFMREIARQLSYDIANPHHAALLAQQLRMMADLADAHARPRTHTHQPSYN